jgi:hypothetical protein
MDIKMPALFDYQQAYHNKAMQNRFNVIAGGRRSAKSFYALFWLLIGGLMGTSDGVCVWLSPTIKQARSVGMSGFVGHLSGFPNSLIELRRGALTVNLAGRDFIFSSTDNADSIRGLKIKRVVLDEAAFQKQYAWENVVRPALADMKGHALMTSTYDGFNWFYEIMQSDNWNKETWPTAINPIITPDEIELLKETMDEQTYKQEILAVPTTAKGLVYERVFGRENIIKNCGPRDGDSTAISIDFGYSDPTAVSFYSYHQATRGRFDTIKFDEMEIRGVLLEEIIPQIIKKLQSYGIEPINLKCAVDIAGKQHTGVSEWSYIERLKAANVFKVSYRKLSKESAINFQRAQFCNAKGERSFKICERCKKSIQSYTAYEIKDNERPFDDAKHDHFPDSDTYFFENLIRPLVGGKEIISKKTKKHETPHMEKCGECGKSFITFTGDLYCTTCKREKILEV